MLESKIKKWIKVLGVFLSLIPILSLADIHYAYRGFLQARALHYPVPLNENSGQQHRAQLEQEAKVGENVLVINQLRWSYSSIYTDLSMGDVYNSKDTHRIFLGDNFFKYKANSWDLQVGYQNISWGESFGFNYADIVNPRDLKETSYSNYSESKLPLFLLNFKYYLQDSSLQLIYSPEPGFNQNLPLSLFTKNFVVFNSVTVKKEKTPNFFNEHEFGGKFSSSFWGIDLAVFYFSYLDRDAHYLLENIAAQSIVVQEKHSRINSIGGSLAMSIGDNFVLRTDLVQTHNKHINSFYSTGLTSYSTSVTNFLIGIDTPTYANFSGVIIYAKSLLSQMAPQSAREKEQSYSICKLSYDFGEEKKFDLSYTRDLLHAGHGFQTQLDWPLNQNLDLAIGGEFYSAKNTSDLNKFKNISNIYLAIKNYFEL